VRVKVARLLACWIVALAGTDTSASRLASSQRSNPPRAGSRASCLRRDGHSVAPAGSYLANGAHVTVDAGQIVYVELIEPAEPGLTPSSFPWPTPKSSNPEVLLPVPICKYPELITSEPVTVTAFRAVGPGTATISAPLERAWKKWQSQHHRAVPFTPGKTFQAFSANATVAAR
jgi:hypothetical protein